MTVEELLKLLREQIDLDPNILDDRVLVAIPDDGGIAYVGLVSLEEMRYRSDNGSVQVYDPNDEIARVEDPRALVFWLKA